MSRRRTAAARLARPAPAGNWRSGYRRRGNETTHAKSTSEGDHLVITINERGDLRRAQYFQLVQRQGSGCDATFGGTVGADIQVLDAKHGQRLQVCAQVLLLDRLGVLAAGQLQDAVVEKQQAAGQVERAAGQPDVQGFPSPEARPRSLAADE